MWKNYLNTSFRNIGRNPGYSAINILGLSIGIAAIILISLYVQFEFAYDRHIPESNNIYRVTTDMRWPDGQHQEVAVCLAPIPWYMMSVFPEVEYATRYYHLGQSLISKTGLVGSSNGGEGFLEDNIIVADSLFFDVFDFKLSVGNSDEILRSPGNVILTTQMAKKYFGDENALGEELLLSNNELLKVAGILEDIPENTHILFDFIVSGPEDPAFSIDDLQSLGGYGYIRFIPGTDIDDFIKKIPQFELEHLGAYDENTDVRIQAMLDIHLKNDRQYDMAIVADRNNVLIIGAIGLIILLLACINFINLTTARSANRSREVGIRKVTGASRGRLIGQFLSESLLIAILSMFVGLVLVETSLPEFRNITNTNIDLDYSNHMAHLVVLTIVVGFLSGFYPALVLSGFQPMAIFRGQSSKRNKRGSLQKFLVITQFSITIALVISLGIILKQMSFIKKTDLGYNYENVNYIDFPINADPGLPILLKNKLSNHAEIERVTLSNMMPGRVPFGEHFIPEGTESWSPHRYINTGYDFIPFFELEIIEGRNFSRDFPTDSSAVLISETTASEFGWATSEAIGKEIKWGFSSSWDDIINGKVIGVFKDFHVTDLHSPMESLIFTMNENFNPVLAFKLIDNHSSEVIEFINRQLREVMPEHPFSPVNLADELRETYNDDYLFLNLVRYFSLIAIIIASLGLLGLSSFMIQKRFKELGIRKTFGASSTSILLLLTVDFEKWVIFSNLIAWPMAWFFSKNWLAQFAYKISIPWWIFLLGFLFSVLLAFLTILYQVLKAAKLRPVEAIRYE